MLQYRWLLGAAALALALGACLGGGAARPRATPSAPFVPPPAATATSRAAGAQPTTAPTVVASPTSAPTATAGPTSAPTPAPSPTATGRPAATPTATGPAAEVLAYIQRLAEGIGPRPAGSPQDKQAAELIAAELQRFGYEVQQQPFAVLPSFGPGILKIQTPAERDVPAAPLRLTGLGSATGDLVDAGLGRPEDFPAGGIKGRIALMERGGQVLFEVKVRNAVAAGAVAAVIYNSEAGPLFGSLQSQASIPVIGIARGEGQALKSLLGEGRVGASVTLTARQSQNVVAVLNKGRPQVVVIGAHYDTVPQTGGASDNSSGTASILVIAREAAKRNYPFELRVIAFGGEELGLVGSRHYVDTLPEPERARILAMLDFDALGSGASLEMEGEEGLRRRAQAAAAANGITVRPSQLQGGSSDHAPFLAANIPAIMVAASDLSRIHTAGDTVAALDTPRLGEAVTLGLALLDSLAGR
ncbi:MAG: M28 family peptidase [Chloroflexi bacterium]|nr:M28 family peptidase [Chloroflexota bacterium]